MNKLLLDITNQQPDFTLAINQDIALNGILGVLGHSGSGKTTLLRTIAGLNKQSQGSIVFNDNCLMDSTEQHFVNSEKRQISLVFQDARLFPHLNVLDNLRFAVKRCRQAKLNIDDIIAMTQIAPLLHKQVNEISSGEKQRVALARAILAEPKLLLLDEPLSALDQRSKKSLLALLKTVHQELRLPMIYVSHHLEEIQQLADQLLVLSSGQVLHLGDVHQVIHQLNHSGLISQQTSLSLPVISHNKAHGLTALAIDQQQIYILSERIKQQDEHIRCFIFANEISLTTKEPVDSSIVNQLKAKIVNITTNDTHTLVHLDCGNHNFYASISSYSLEKLALQHEQWVYMQFKASAVRT